MLKIQFIHIASKKISAHTLLPKTYATAWLYQLIYPRLPTNYIQLYPSISLCRKCIILLPFKPVLSPYSLCIPT